MKEVLLIGMIAGLVAGAVIATTCKPVQNIVNSGKEEVKKMIEKIK